MWDRIDINNDCKRFNNQKPKDFIFLLFVFFFSLVYNFVIIIPLI